MSDDDFLRRWARRKSEAKSGVAPASEPSAESPQGSVAIPVPAETQGPAEPLPPVESLTPESDFRPFMQPDVEPGVRQQALKTLFRSPGFNVMDGLDTYIDDYSKPDPLPASWLAKMNQMERLGDFAKTLLEEDEEGTAAAPSGAEKAIEDQEVEEPASSVASNTSDAVIQPPPVAE